MNYTEYTINKILDELHVREIISGIERDGGEENIKLSIKKAFNIMKCNKCGKNSDKYLYCKKCEKDNTQKLDDNSKQQTQPK